jgi:hypothetical protein
VCFVLTHGHTFTKITTFIKLLQQLPSPDCSENPLLFLPSKIIKIAAESRKKLQKNKKSIRSQKTPNYQKVEKNYFELLVIENKRTIADGFLLLEKTPYSRLFTSSMV